MGKFYLECQSCGTKVEAFKNWFEGGQQCPQCASKQAYVNYTSGYEGLKDLLANKDDPSSLWHYLQYLPIKDSGNIVSFTEGIVDIERWPFLENYANDYFNISCHVYVQRFDQNRATGTFKDMAGTVVSSVLTENQQRDYVVASTGNIGNAYAKYLSAAGINLYAFIPSNSSREQEAGIAGYGQQVYRVNGDYAAAKKLAADFARENEMILAAGNFDPMRIEAKKIMVYEWLRKMDEFPSVYMQALSGGTGPLGIQKAFNELMGIVELNNLPRQILVQTGNCDPMTQAWNSAKAAGFPEGWENDYPIIENPSTYVATLATGNPQTYPVIAPFVRETGGDIISSSEKNIAGTAAWVAAEKSILIGPAATVTITGFMSSVGKGLIGEGDIVLLNLGEGISRSASFLNDLSEAGKLVSSVDECNKFDLIQKKHLLLESLHDSLQV